MEKPNIIFIVLDSLRADRLKDYGSEKEILPNLEKLCKTSTVFTDMTSNGAWSVPSFVTMLTGLNPLQHKVVSGKTLEISDEIPRIAGFLKGIGYYNFLISQQPYVSVMNGHAKNFHECNEVWKKRIVNMGEYFRKIYEKLADGKCPRLILNLLKKLKTVSDSGGALLNKYFKKTIHKLPEPFFCFGIYVEPCGPLLKGLADELGIDYKKYRDVFTKELKGEKHFKSPFMFYFEGINKKVLADNIEFAYNAKAGYTDSLLGEVFSYLKEKKIFDDSMIIITSDHGTSIGEHDFYSHMFNLYEPNIRVPLIIKMPGQDKKKIIEKSVQTVDIAATILDIAGTDKKELKKLKKEFVLPGVNILKEFSENRLIVTELTINQDYFDRHIKAIKNTATAEMLRKKCCRKSIAVKKSNYKLIIYSDGEKELFDLFKDKEENVNLISEQPDIAKQIEQEFNELKIKLKIRNNIFE